MSIVNSSSVQSLPRSFRKLSIEERRQLLQNAFDYPPTADPIALADAMVESAIGYRHIPMGVVTSLRIDNVPRTIPLATEEPSVIAALQYGGAILATHGGLSTTVAPPLMGAQIFLEGCHHHALSALQRAHADSLILFNKAFHSLQLRGGGLRDLQYRWITGDKQSSARILVVEFWVDVRDALGANRLNSAAELLAPHLAAIAGGRRLFAILSNAAERRLATAAFTLPVGALRSRTRSPAEIARAIVLASDIAQHDPRRAITHNKGIMNGVSAVALATGNDTRALEAAVHGYASRDGRYRGLSHYQVRGAMLTATLTMPLPLALVGGAVALQSESRAALRMLQVQSSSELSAVAAAVGLTQNFAALLALVGEGIQSGHMRRQALRLAWRAGARQAQLSQVAEELHRRRRYTVAEAQKIYKDVLNNEAHD